MKLGERTAVDAGDYVEIDVVGGSDTTDCFVGFAERGRVIYASSYGPLPGRRC